ncbi:hypothetical protein [Clostridium beijerinckii]|uniref:hypothetical protein n=1 Tax=Clostridium beijerinckii TaxID=1520 RepID=UPI0013613BB5|nr:hypothetical protein [Clostridium beijerinckii]MZK49037.1 hypothetical protein [Clostridium beijerinckii]MZK57412.1 hypothetical protein [Clostridium beijerinckii]MZK67623.1 hypothetical protein [Clostridium beijerinckii]MZK72708.1 hypothetical protein [Clostridium beijerinckii]MZK82304.1 hypothetical protein [Clostridium beijerinckii]
MDLRKCLEDLIMMYDNDVCCGIQDDEERKNAKVLLGEVIILLTKLQLGIKCCENENCPVSPKRDMKRLFDNNATELRRLIPYEVNYDFILSLL